MKKHLPWVLLLASPVVFYGSDKGFGASCFEDVGQVVPGEPWRSPTTLAPFDRKTLWFSVYRSLWDLGDV